MTPSTNIVVNNYYGNLTPEQIERHKEVSREIANKIVGKDKSKLEETISKVSHALLNHTEVLLFRTARISKKVLKAMLLEILPNVSLKIIKLAPALLAILI